ncbi:MAG: MEKHLA domain-containing protein [Methylomicrobium sp.]
MMQNATIDSAYLVEHAMLIGRSYRRLLGEPLLDGVRTEKAFADALFHAPFAVVTHDTSDDPVFNYANVTALSLFEMNWSEFTQTPSRLSAEPVNRQERSRLLSQVTEHGFIKDYSGVRISKNGKRFIIEQAVVWNLLDESDNYRGQAACFSRWRYL